MSRLWWNQSSCSLMGRLTWGYEHKPLSLRQQGQDYVHLTIQSMITEGVLLTVEGYISEIYIYNSLLPPSLLAPSLAQWWVR